MEKGAGREVEGEVEVSWREMVGGEEEVEVVKERREEDIPGSALMMAGSAGPHIWAWRRLVEEEEVWMGDTLCLI